MSPRTKRHTLIRKNKKVNKEQTGIGVGEDEKMKKVEVKCYRGYIVSFLLSSSLCSSPGFQRSSAKMLQKSQFCNTTSNKDNFKEATKPN